MQLITNETKLSKELRQHFIRFIEAHHPSGFNAGLRLLLLDCMSAQINTGFHVDFDILLIALNDLFDLMNATAKESLLSATKNSCKG